MSVLDEFFDPIKNAEIRGKSNNFVPGLYLVTCTDIQFLEGSRKEAWFIVNWRIDFFKGCKHNTYSPEGVEKASSVGYYSAGQSVGSIYNMKKDTNEQHVKAIWLALLGEYPDFAELSMDQLAEGFSKSDIHELVENKKAVGLSVVTEVSNGGMDKDKKTGVPQGDYHNHVWYPLSRYEGQRFWESSSDEDDV